VRSVGRIVWLSHLCCGWINNLLDFRDAVCREAASLSVRSKHCFVLGNIDAVDLVPSEIAKAIADQLQAKLSPSEKSAIEPAADDGYHCV
jgi:hypothetical protein